MSSWLHPQTESDLPQQSSGFLDSRPRIFWVCVVVLFVVAGAVRMYHVGEPGVLIDREYRSAILARAFYFSNSAAAENWQREIAATQKERTPILEPPVTEYFVSLIYRAIGSERLWVSHVLTSFFWLVGGIFLYQTTKIIVSLDAAVIASAYYLFTPLSILVSRSFQPDALMMMLFLISLFGILKYYQKPATLSLLLAAGITGMTILYRPLVFFALLGAFTSLAIYRRRSWKFALDPKFLLFIGISLLPSFLYYGYGILIAGFLRWQADSSFQPHLYMQQEYWLGWLHLAGNGAGLLAIVGALLGLPTLRKGLPRALLAGLWFGYLVFGLVFTVHIHTHGYYQAQLIPIVAISLGSLGALYARYVQQMDNRWHGLLPVAAAMSVIIYFDLSNVREQIGSQVFESPQLAQEIGKYVNHSSETVFVAPFYGMPLQYYGEFAGTRWPKADESILYEAPPDHELTVEERMNGFGYVPDYFIITDFRWLDSYHADLKEYLQQQCSLLAQSAQYQIYDGSCAE
jgi:4-amino-4-deoxy-L-arabinose transferase-like glycosyltransferase